jgi:hypothetical protein
MPERRSTSKMEDRHKVTAKEAGQIDIFFRSNDDGQG